MKKITKIIAVLLTVVMMLSVASVNCFAVEAEDFKLDLPEFDFADFGKVASKAAKANKAPAANKAASGRLIIDEDVDFAEYAGTDITNVIIEEGCEYVDSLAFSLCENLETVIINAENCEISLDAFIGCSNLEKITVVADNEFYVTDSKGILYNEDMTAIYYAPAKAVGSSYTMPESIETVSPVAFVDCSDFALTLSKNYEGDGGEFMDICVSEFKVNSQNPYFRAIDGVLFSKDGTELIKYPLNCDKFFYSIPEKVEYIYPQAFASQNYAVFIALELGEYADLNNKSLFYVTDYYLNLHMSENVAEVLISDEYFYYSIIGLDEICIEGLTGEETEILNEYIQAYVDEYEAQYEEILEEYEPGTPEYEYIEAMCYVFDSLMPEFSPCDDVHNRIDFVEIIEYPDKYTYNYKTENLDLTGILIEVTYIDGRTEEISAVDLTDAEISGFDNMQTGVQTVTLETEDFVAEFDVEVTYSWWQWLIVIFLFGWIWY